MHLELAIAPADGAVENHDRLEQTAQPDRGARRQVAGRHEGRIGAHRRLHLLVKEREELREARNERRREMHPLRRLLQRVHVLNREPCRQLGLGRAPHPRPQDAVERPGVGEAPRDEADERDPIDEGQEVVS